MAYDFNSLTKQAPEASNRDGFYTDFEDVDPSKLHQITELTNWMRTKAKGSDVREVIAQLFDRTWLESIKEGNANMEVAQARGEFVTLSNRLNNFDAEIQNVASGSPKGVYANLSELQSAKPNGDSGIYVTTDNGHWWYWNGSWRDGGVYQARELSSVQRQEIARNDIKFLLQWSAGKKLSLADGVVEAVNADIMVAKAKLKKGTVITAKLYGGSGLASMSSGSESLSITPIANKQENGLMECSYTVQADYEYIYFQLLKSQWSNCYIYVDDTNSLAEDENRLDTKWHYGYIDLNGAVNESKAYIYTDLIKLPSFHKLSFSAFGGNYVSFLSEYSSDGTFLRKLFIGDTTGQAKKIDYVSASDTYLKICTKTDRNFNFKFSDINPTITKYEVADKMLVTPDVASGYLTIDGQRIMDNDFKFGHHYTANILLMPGQTIEFKASAANDKAILSQWTEDYTFVKTLVAGNDSYRYTTYTADTMMYVRICSRIRKSGGKPYVNPEIFKKPSVYFKPLYNQKMQQDGLYNKKVLLIGDSLTYGNILGNDAVWANHLALKYNWQVYNYGINGNNLSSTPGSMGTPMVERLDSIEEVADADIIVVSGGANDKRNNGLIGENNDDVTSTFKGACNVIIDTLREKNPNARLLFMTTWKRWPQKNSIGLGEEDYAKAMLEVCWYKSVPCFDNFGFSGISFVDSHLRQKFDEGLWLGLQENSHFNPDGYSYLANIYDKWLKNYF